MAKFNKYKEMGVRLENRGKSNKEIIKELRAEYRGTNEYYRNDDYLKKNWKAYGKKNERLDFREALRVYDPTTVSLTTRKRSLKNMPKMYKTYTKNTKIDWRQDPSGKVTIDEYLVNNKRFTENQIKNNLEFAKDFKRKARNVNTRFKNANKAIDLSQTTIEFEGKNEGLFNLYDMRMKETDRIRKAQITKKINEAFKQLKTVKRKDILNTKKKVIKPSIEKIKNGLLVEALEGTFDTTTYDNNGNTVKWKTAGSDPRIIISFNIAEHNGEIMHNQHIAQLEEQDISTTAPESEAQLELFYAVA